MKKIISVFFALALVSAVAFAQPAKGGKKGNENAWRERVQAEQAAYFTSELNLSPAEAQVFWPVFNEVQQQRAEAFKASSEAFKALQEGASGPDAAKLLDNYMAAKAASDKLNVEALGRFKEVLSVEKVAKLIVAEENFRRNQIGKLGGKGHGHGNGGHHGGNRPGGAKGHRQ